MIVNGDIGANGFADGFDHHFVMGAGETDGGALADAGGEHDGLSAHLHHLLGPVNSPLAGTAAAADDAHDLDLLVLRDLREAALVELGDLKIGSTGTHILGLHAANETNLHNCSSLYVSVTI